MSSDIVQLTESLTRHGFTHFGFAELKTPLSMAIYENWIATDQHGDMAYLSRHVPEKREPTRLLAQGRSAIVVTMNYVPHPEPLASMPVSSSLKVAAYARGRDYHFILRERLQNLIKEWTKLFPEEQFLLFTDSGPVMERDLAHRAGLGWIGKNTCLLDRHHGSLFFIAEIYTTLQLPSASVLPSDHCGTCTRCLDACPTGALTAPRQLDARLCISYLTIESRQVPPLHLREKIRDLFFGCDICQTVCPWNQKVFGKKVVLDLEQDPNSSREALVRDLRFILSASNRQLEKSFRGSPLLRAGSFGLKRNALVVASHHKMAELTSEISGLLNHPKLGELANWCLHRLQMVHPPQDQT